MCMYACKLTVKYINGAINKSGSVVIGCMCVSVYYDTTTDGDNRDNQLPHRLLPTSSSFLERNEVIEIKSPETSRKIISGT